MPNEDELVSQALRVPERQMEVRALLATGEPPSAEFLDAVVAALGVDAPLVHQSNSRNCENVRGGGASAATRISSPRTVRSGPSRSRGRHVSLVVEEGQQLAELYD